MCHGKMQTDLTQIYAVDQINYEVKATFIFPFIGIVNCSSEDVDS